MAVLQLQLLGGFQARLGRRSLRLPRKAQALLAYLALAPRAQAPRASLATRFWGEGAEDDARNNLCQVLFRIRRSLRTASGAVALEGDTVGLDTALIDTDAITFQRLATRGGETSLAEAAELYRGDLLEGLDVGEPSFDEWLRGERERLRQLGIDVLSRCLAKDLERGRREAAIQTALRLLAMDPLQEDVHQTLMRAYAGEGRRTAPLRQYQICVDALQRELQVEPEPGTRTLYLDILRQPRPRAPSAPPTARSAAPRGFGGPPLIGRDAEMTRMRQELAGAARRGGRIVALLGEAGVGKTRVLQEVMAEAAASGWVVLEGRGHETEQGLPFALWVGACRSAGAIDDARLRDLALPWREPLTTLFPEIAAGARPAEGASKRGSAPAL